MRFLIIRHGETEHNREDSITGQMDVALNDHGIEQAEKASDRLEKYDFAAVYSSDLQRTYETTRIIAERHDLHPEPYKELRERSYGVFEGKNKEEWREVVRETEGDNYELKPEQGETMKQTGQRYVELLIDISEKHREDDKVLVGGHGVAIICLILEILGLKGEDYRKFNQDNTGLTELEYTDGDWSIIRMNDTSHLE